MAHKARKKNVLFKIPNHSSVMTEDAADTLTQNEELQQEEKGHKQWWNNGEKNILSVDCPEGFVKGKIKK